MASIARWTPFRELDAIERRLRRAFEDIGLLSTLLPATDVYETVDEFVVELEVPGYEESELSIEIAGHTLKIRGERVETFDKAGKDFRSQGRLRRKFERRFDLPSEADTEHISAVFDKGVLEVHTPKRQKATTQKVEISKPGGSKRQI